MRKKNNSPGCECTEGKRCCFYKTTSPSRKGMPWIFGTVVQQWWDFAGDSDRNHVNLTNIQYVVFYSLTAETNIGLGSPNITVNWDADSDNQWTAPVGLGWNTTTKIGKLPVKIGFEVSYAVISPDRFGNT